MNDFFKVQLLYCLIQLHAEVHRRGERDLATHLGDRDGFPGSWHQTAATVLAPANIWRVNQQMETGSRSLPLT